MTERRAIYHVTRSTDLAGVVSERAFARTILELAALTGWTVYHGWTSIHSAAGFPDLVLVKPPRVLFCELKTERGRTTAAQEAWQTLLRECPGVECFVWRPSAWPAIVATLGGERILPAC